MLKTNSYVFAKSLDEAYELNKKRANVIVGGNGWLRLGSKQKNTVIDLSQLGLEGIKEDAGSFVIGAMTTLRELETNDGFNRYTDGAAKESLRHIVGTQFRNCATVGGSIFGRFGFSDVLSLFIALDSYVELFKGGMVPMSEFAKMKYDNDILVNVIVKKHKIKAAYSSFRNQSTDFPVLTCCVCVEKDKITTSIGARPARADIACDEKSILADYYKQLLNGEALSDSAFEAALKEYAEYTAGLFKYGSNLRASAEYREHLAEVLIRRTVKAIAESGTKRS